MKVKVSIEVTVQRASKEVCAQFNQPYGTWEIISEGCREAFASDQHAAMQEARGLLGSDRTTSLEVVE